MKLRGSRTWVFWFWHERVLVLARWKRAPLAVMNTRSHNHLKSQPPEIMTTWSHDHVEHVSNVLVPTRLR